ncbi:MAG: hypothetical protein ABSC55_28360, partial [Syntrophorhabdales bacterium]
EYAPDIPRNPRGARSVEKPSSGRKKLSRRSTGVSLVLLVQLVLLVTNRDLIQACPLSEAAVLSKPMKLIKPIQPIKRLSTQAQWSP